jgi:aminoglycoside phosphotransferase (APT) family kinase protein
MDLERLQALIAAEIRVQADPLGLEPDAIRVRFVVNWGGFTNRSFTIGDGHRRFHLKLTDDPAGQEAFRRWHRVHPALSARYHAPRVVGWLAIPGSRHEGLLFHHLDGAAPPGWSSPLRLSVAEVLRRLHVDREVRAAILPSNRSTTCAQGYFDDFHDRFSEDLALVAEHPPEFVSQDLLDWLADEVADLAAAVGTSPAFQGPADSLIHGDIWPENILLVDPGWYLLDWDELRLGDPVHDLAKLVDPGTAAGAPPTADEVTAVVGEDAARRDRLELYRRAILLDWIIDPLADHLAANEAPEHADAMRSRKEREHREALARYRERY